MGTPKKSNLVQAAEAARAAGRGGDDHLVHMNSFEMAELAKRWGEPKTNPHTGLPEYSWLSRSIEDVTNAGNSIVDKVTGGNSTLKKMNPLTGYLNPVATIGNNWEKARDTAKGILMPGTLNTPGNKSVFGDTFARGSKFQRMFVPEGVSKLALGQDQAADTMGAKIQRDPRRLFHADPVSNGLNNAIFDKNEASLTNAIGSPSNTSWEDIQSEHPTTDFTRAKDFSKIGDTIAGIFGGGALASAFGGAGAAADAGTQGLSQAGASGADALAGTSGALEGAGSGLGSLSSSTLAPIIVEGGNAGLSAAAEQAAAAAAAAAAGYSSSPDASDGSADGTHQTPPHDSQPGYLDRTVAYAKNPQNWPAIVRAGQTLSQYLNHGDSGSAGPGGSAGSPLDIDYSGRQFNDYQGDYSHYGEGAQHNFYTPGHAKGGRIQLTLRSRPGFSTGGVANAESTRQLGRKNDQVLLHLSPREFDLIKSHWGEPETNPHTGLPEYAWLDDVFDKISNSKLVNAISGYKESPLHDVHATGQRVDEDGNPIGPVPESNDNHQGFGTGLAKLSRDYLPAIVALASVFHKSPGPVKPSLEPSVTGHLQNMPFNRTRTSNDGDYYTYGQRPQTPYYSNNQTPSSATAAGTLLQADGGYIDRGQGVGYNAGSRAVRGPGSGRSDSIPARLSDGEYVIDAETTALLGDGSTDAGAAKLDKMRENIRKHKGKALSKGKISPDAGEAAHYLDGGVK